MKAEKTFASDLDTIRKKGDVGIVLYERYSYNDYQKNEQIKKLSKLPNFANEVIVPEDDFNIMELYFIHFIDSLNLNYKDYNDLVKDLTVVSGYMLDALKSNRPSAFKMRFSLSDSQESPVFHINKECYKLFFSYLNPSIEYTIPENVNWEHFGSDCEFPEQNNMKLIKDFLKVEEVKANTVAILKGESFEMDILHRSAPIKINEKTLLLTMETIYN